MELKKSGPLKGVITVPGDKSISHRAVMLGAIAEGITEISNFLQGADCLATIHCFRQMGIEINNDLSTNKVIIYGKGLHGLCQPKDILDVGNSGTTMRLISGILSGQNFKVSLTGDASIQKRPMGRIMSPLTQMGGDIKSKENNDCAPLIINGLSKKPKKLKGIHYHSPVASAQIKSALLLAGLYADGETKIREPYLSRNHTELMLEEFGAKITSLDHTATLSPDGCLVGNKINVPGDISSAAYFIVAGLIIPNSEILIKNVGINPTRDGILRVCKAMGGDITLENVRKQSGEMVADILVKHSSLIGTEIAGEIIPTLIDEIPILAILASFAKGTTIIKDAAELKVKESNRIDVVVNNLKKMGGDISATEDGMIIKGGKVLQGALIESKDDHRIAMSFAVAAYMAEGPTRIKGAECVNISYPNFYTDLNNLKA